MFRRFRQWLAGQEISKLADEIERSMDQLQALAHKIEGHQLALERLRNRVQMRLARAGVPRGERTDEDILDELRAGRGRSDELVANPFDE